jgi:8-oxo-dGTP diphosphatase
MSTVPQIEVSAGILFRNGLLLLTQRRDGDHLGGLWEFPGGKREPGETFEVCLRRELREELGVEVEVGELLDTVTHDYPEKRVYLRFFRGRLLEGDPRPIGCQDLVWVSRHQLRDYSFPPADCHLLNLLESRADLWEG